MNIRFVYLDREALIACKESDTVKLYDVPTEYSEDGFYAAVWQQGNVEPRPACAGNAARLLAEIAIQEDKDGVVIGGMLVEGVEAYATH